MNEIITTATGLDALPAQTVGRWNENGGCVWEKRVSGRWRSPSDSRPYSAEWVARYPLTLLYRPDAEPAADRLDVQTAMAYGLGVEDGQREPARTEDSTYLHAALAKTRRELFDAGFHEAELLSENRALAAAIPEAWAEGLRAGYEHVARLEAAESAGQGVMVPDPVNPYSNPAEPGRANPYRSEANS